MRDLTVPRGNLKNCGDFVIGVVLRVKERHGGLRVECRADAAEQAALAS
jgi:hypothetical protein